MQVILLDTFVLLINYAYVYNKDVNFVFFQKSIFFDYRICVFAVDRRYIAT